MTLNDAHDNSFPKDDQMITAILVRSGEVTILGGRVLVAKRRGIVVSFESEADARPDRVAERDQSVTLLYGRGERVLRLRTKVAEVIPPHKVLLEPVAEVTEGERREFLRAELDMHLVAACLPERAPVGAGDSWPMQSVDLSGSGVKFLWTGTCQKGDHLELRLALPSRAANPVTAKGEVVRADPTDDGRLDVALHFTDVSDADRDVLINCVFRRYYEHLGNQLGTVIDPD